MQYAIIGHPGDGATVLLDYRAFAYAGKFVVGATGKAVCRTTDGTAAAPDWIPSGPLPETVPDDSFDEDIVAAVSYSPDRTDSTCCRIRYVTVHVARQGEGIGPDLLDWTISRLQYSAHSSFETVRIAVNNPFAYEALYKVGFAYTGETTGLAELELARPIAAVAAAHDDVDAYRAGLTRFQERDHSPAEGRFLNARAESMPPDPMP